MKKITLLIFSFSILSCNTKNNDSESITKLGDKQKVKLQNETVEEFGEKIFNLIKTNNLDSILKFTAKLNDYASTYENSDYLKKNKIDKIKYFTENEYVRTVELKESYKETIDYFNENNIDLSESKLNHIDFEYEKKHTVEKAQVYLKFNNNKKNYNIHLKSCYRIKGKWYIGNEIDVKNYRNSFEE